MSGDGDFTGLARRLQRRGKRVVGIGLLQQSAVAFRKACDEFVAVGPKEGTATEPRIASEQDRAHFLKLVEQVLADAGNGWRPLSWLGMELRKVEPEIQYARYGKSGLLALLKTFPARVEWWTTAPRNNRAIPGGQRALGR